MLRILTLVVVMLICVAHHGDAVVAGQNRAIA